MEICGFPGCNWSPGKRGKVWWSHHESLCSKGLGDFGAAYNWARVGSSCTSIGLIHLVPRILGFPSILCRHTCCLTARSVVPVPEPCIHQHVAIAVITVQVFKIHISLGYIGAASAQEFFWATDGARNCWRASMAETPHNCILVRP